MTNEHIFLFHQAKSSWIYPMYIPSYNRAGSAPLLEMMRNATESVRRKVRVVVRPEQAESYRHSYPWATVIVEARPGIGPARIRALKDAEKMGYSHIVVLDDDIIHLSLLERITNEKGMEHSRRYSTRVSGVSEPGVLLRSLAVGCALAYQVFSLVPEAAYGAARNALFSGGVDVSVGASLNKGSFPACVMFFDISRFSMRKMPTPFQYHGEDLAMFLHTMEEGQLSFTLPGVAYDQHGGIPTTIPLDPLSETGRPHLNDTPRYYPHMHPYLRVSMKNRLGGAMRIGVNWSRYYKETGTGPIEIPLTKLLH